MMQRMLRHGGLFFRVLLVGRIFQFFRYMSHKDTLSFYISAYYSTLTTEWVVPISIVYSMAVSGTMRKVWFGGDHFACKPDTNNYSVFNSGNSHTTDGKTSAWTNGTIGVCCYIVDCGSCLCSHAGSWDSAPLRSDSHLDYIMSGNTAVSVVLSFYSVPEDSLRKTGDPD